MKKCMYFLVVFCAVAAAALLHGRAEAEKGQDTVRLPIVMYHHMSEKQRLTGKYVLGVNEFENDLKYLREQGYESITMAELLAWYDGTGELPEKPFMITFDDGYESTGVYAAPLLEEYGYTGIVAIIGKVADLFTEQPDHMLDYSHLSWQAIRELSERGVLEVQCHTYNMHTLDTRRGCARKKGESLWNYREVLTKDLTQFLDACAVYGVQPVMSIAYPFGSYTSDTIDVVRELGFVASFTCEEMVNELTGEPEELYHLHRYNRPSGISSRQFFARWD